MDTESPVNEISLPEEFRDGGAIDLTTFKAMGWEWEGHRHFFEGHKLEGYECPRCKEDE